jgi:hypothetical protein
MSDDYFLTKSASEFQPNPGRPVIEPGFWHRQFSLQPTTPQIVFDVLFGIVGPILCFMFDPIAFRGGIAGFGKPLFQAYQVFAYMFSAFAIAALTVWLIFGSRLTLGKRFISGVLVSGSLFCVVIGCVLLPFSVIGLVILIGIFGFTPFATAIVYLRNASRAARSPQDAAPVVRLGAVVFGCVLTLGAPALLSLTVHQIAAASVNEILHGDSQHVAAATERLQMMRFLANAEVDGLLDAYSGERDSARQDILRNSYREITGEDLEARRLALDD